LFLWIGVYFEFKSFKEIIRRKNALKNNYYIEKIEASK